MNTLSPDEKILAVLEHIERVQKNCIKIGLKLIRSGEVEMGRMLIHNGQIHDNSKLSGIEFEHLFRGDDLLQEAVKHHASTNAHHPEFWGKIQNMPEIYIAEMICDCSARSSEFGTDVREWFKLKATDKYNFSFDDSVGLLISKYLDLLLEQSF
jgi:hypothetical protein